MPGILNVSEAASLAFHTAVFLAREPERSVSVVHMASLLGVSEAHLAKVMQRLAKAGVVRSTRGPKGGFRLAKDPEETTLLDVYEGVEGPLAPTGCLLDRQACSGTACVLGDLLHSLNHQIERYLTGTRLADLTQVYDHLGLTD